MLCNIEKQTIEIKILPSDLTYMDSTSDSILNHKTIESRWSVKWSEAKLFESNPDPKKEKRYVTAAFPYPNSPQHIGHARTYATTDIYARYLRLKGYNVLFPMAFHVTGTPILAMAKRIAEGDRELFDIFENIYGIPPEQTKKLANPTDLVMHFSKEIEAGMKEMGFSIDWRRKFYSFDRHFGKFIQWQFRKLKSLGYLVQGEHPIAWCPKDNQAVGGHDTKGDIDPEMKDFTAIKFAYSDGKDDGYILTATLRPETIYAVTNIWINPTLSHVKARSKKTGEIYYIVKRAYEKMNFQGFELEIVEEFLGKHLIDLGKKAKNPITSDEIPIYPANYVKDDSGTGMVMSVPSHAPYDHVALVDMGIHLDYKPVVRVEGYKFMAKELIETLGIRNQFDPRLEDVVKEVYKKEILTGVMVLGPYKGEKVSTAIDKTKADMLTKKLAYPFWEINNKPVYCRCGAETVATILKNQWFIDYSQESWKEKTKECIASMTIIPEKTRSEYLYTIDWLKQKACARSQGLGTKFPFDEKLVIEALSDSTIYMAYYTIAHIITQIPESEIDDEFFDFVFLGKEPKNRSKISKEWKEAKESFLYWYPLDSRHSAGDLIRNHLPFFIFIHVAIFDKKFWPKQIATNGFVLMDGKKMSKSMGNILPLRKAIAEYGADVVRFSVVAGAELSSDTDFNRGVADGVRSRLELIMKLAKDFSVAKLPPCGRMEKWLLSRLHQRIKKSEKMYGQLAMRELALELFYEVFSDLQWYIKRSESVNLKHFLPIWSSLMSPFMPHYAQELWHLSGNNGFVSDFPKADEGLIDPILESGEELIIKVHGDIEKISNLIGKKPSKVTLYVASEWKRKLYALAKSIPNLSFELLMKSAAAEKMPMKEVQNVVKQIMKNLHSISAKLSQKEELEALSHGSTFFAKDYGCVIEVLTEEDGKHDKAKSALPDKPAIVIE